MERIFKTRTFTRAMRKSGLTDEALVTAVEEITKGLVEADLGGHLLKKRVAAQGRGKQGGIRTLVATRLENRWFFLFGFHKNERSNITSAELRALQEVAKDLLALTDEQLHKATLSGELKEINK
ncbi:type II toxin-antitoxin system RelE/ParE family toxin [Marinobacter sp.]|uniref:type II toxin-antitoxin system RelE/ParE family toxin n=1 Tax=Marinobacter sp. TaxID=50741 RepID=UPI0025BC5EE7|nr:type II toxin-antitoxin system RelE/ParE family toxin [Marinobacter sp.]